MAEEQVVKVQVVLDDQELGAALARLKWQLKDASEAAGNVGKRATEGASAVGS